LKERGQKEDRMKVEREREEIQREKEKVKESIKKNSREAVT
jgi:hypothetical protein